jgi:hypothetical protein
MSNLFGWSGSKRTAIKLEYQVSALIAAVACAAFIGNGYLVERSELPTQPSPVLGAKVAASLIEVSFSDQGLRSLAASPVEFAAVYGLAADKPYTALAAAEWSAPTPLARKPDEVPAAKPHRKPVLVAQACSGECGTAATAAMVTPPPRPADLASTVTAQAAPSEEKRVRLLGLSLPGFVPTGEKIAKTVVSWGGSIAGVIPGL